MAVTQSTEILTLANRLAANIKLKSDYRAFVNKDRKLLIVEGSTDEKFVEKIKCNDVDCVVANKIFKSNDVFRTTPSASIINCKNAIVTLIRGVSHFPSPFLKYPDDVDKWALYGLVDLDCDELISGKPTPRLFVTDTHDLETLILSTDKNVLHRIDQCKIPVADISKAMYMTYQLAFVRNLLFDYRDNDCFQINSISSGTCWVKFGQFFDDNKINLYKIVQHISNESRTPLTEAKVKKIALAVLNSKLGKKKFTKDGLWKEELINFDYSSVEDFWKFINGHDVLQMLAFLNESVFFAFYQNQGSDLNRQFEVCIIDAYEYQNFKKTALYQKMNEENLLLSTL